MSPRRYLTTTTSMEAPYTIASLPTPLDVRDGNTQAAPVYGMRGSRKRKRHEVAVGIDGEGVNIYNVHHDIRLCTFAGQMLNVVADPGPILNRLICSPATILSLLSPMLDLPPSPEAGSCTTTDVHRPEGWPKKHPQSTCMSGRKCWWVSYNRQCPRGWSEDGAQIASWRRPRLGCY